MLMLHGLGADTFSRTLEPTPTAPTTTKYLLAYDAATLSKTGSYVAPSPYATRTPVAAGCPSGMVQTEFGCMSPTKPAAECHKGSIQTGNGCLPAVPATAPTRKPPVVFPPPPAPPPQQIVQPPPQEPVYQPPPQQSAPPISTDPVATTSAPQQFDYQPSQQLAPVAPPLKPMTKGLMIAGGLGIAALIGLSLFRQ